jgi:hypothetical protein
MSVGGGLHLQDPVHGAYQRDQIVHCRIALFGRELRVFSAPIPTHPEWRVATPPSVV